MKNSFEDLTYEELLNKREELKKKYIDLRFDMVIGHVDNRLEKRTIRRAIARVNTVIHEYSLEIRK